mmetsp:Transcript_5231/g.11542  ORF Transcript_5231/g.11542 Transcript_5231/m.11542 type:complete len:197 (-) Transcript_5231:1164-1754(-)|eukprot:CAMPEP_0168725830 /NCGR_PEP_ID=MMETSP0724-20121128/4357_1 /TAXON_ID=265536 /ORGANISM="Amphiprora sp., Strain CCMP467" /LENGTH=196 /DNA_ID=CAMNT_0008772629 /DNA_START=11 /DNA_END=601 /DNA_ORIENTATION=-
MTYGNFQSDQQLLHESPIYQSKAHSYDNDSSFSTTPAPVFRGSELHVPTTPINGTTRTRAYADDFASPSSSSLSSLDDTPTKDLMVSYYDDQETPNALVCSTSHGEPGKLPEEIVKMKKNRKRRTVVAGVTGATVGLVALGPIGMVFGGVGSAVTAKVVGKRMEKRKMEKIAAHNIRQELAKCPSSSIKVHDATFS